MRMQFLNTSSRRKAITNMPWASKIVKVSGGYIGFESVSDYETWKNQR